MDSAVDAAHPWLLLAGGLIATRLFIRMVRGEPAAQESYAAQGGRIIVIGANRLATGFIQMLNAYAPQRQPVIALLDADPSMVGARLLGCRYSARRMISVGRLLNSLFTASIPIAS